MAILKKLLLFVVLLQICAQSRLKDVAKIEGVRGNQLIGYGLVVGLAGTGDSTNSFFTVKSVANMLESFGIKVDPKQIKVKNTAAVLVTADLPPFAGVGTTLDVVVSSVGNAKSLSGGTLVMTPLRGPDGNIYAVAQGPLTVGGYIFETSRGDSVTQNHPTVGYISNGAIVERAINFDFSAKNVVRVYLKNADFTTAQNIQDQIDSFFGVNIATALDGATIDVDFSHQVSHGGELVKKIAQLENLPVTVDQKASVVVNERTGTVIVSEDVRVSRVAIAHGNISIIVRQTNRVIQPNPLAQGETAVEENTDISVGEEKRVLNELGGDIPLSELVRALNALGVTPRDLVSIFSALQKAGALNADLTVM